MVDYQIILGNALDVLKTLESESVQTCVTSPPYFGLRDYGVDGQLGLESSPQEFISNLRDVFLEVRRVLKKDGTIWLNLGDSYSSIGHKKSHSGFNTSTLAGGEQTHTPLAGRFSA